MTDQITRTLKLLQSFGCPKCSGDCAGAIPPVATCPMDEIRKALADVKDIRRSIECAAGCDAGTPHDIAYSEVLIFGGTALASAYDKLGE